MSNLTVAALAARAECSPVTVRKWARENVERQGRDYLFDEARVAAFLGRKRTPGPKRKPEAELTRSAKSQRKTRAGKWSSARRE